MSARAVASAARRGLAVLLLLPLAATCQRDAVDVPLRTPAGARPHLLLVTVSALRPDHLGAYGFPVPTSPTIDGVAAGGVRVTEAIATSPSTSPAMASLLTGLYQYRSRVLFDGGTLPAEVTTLAERLHAAGYRTAAVVGSPRLTAARGFAQGFDHFTSFARPRGGDDAAGVDGALAWLAERPAAPWFLWLHLVAPAGPYATADASWSADLAYPPYMFGRDAPFIAGPSDFGLGVVPKRQQLPGLTHPSELVRRYDGEIRYADAQLARLLAALAPAEAAGDVLVVLTADHGESLTEHRELFQHGWFVYDTTLRIPLLVRWTGVLPAGRVVDAQVSAVDLAPTLDELLGLGSRAPGAPPPFDGTSFARRLLGDDLPPAGPAFAIGAGANRPFAMRWGGWKLIYTPAGRPPVPLGRAPARRLDTPERIELYNLRTDPDELTNVAHSYPPIVAMMRRQLARFRQSARGGS